MDNMQIIYKTVFRIVKIYAILIAVIFRLGKNLYAVIAVLSVFRWQAICKQEVVQGWERGIVVRQEKRGRQTHGKESGIRHYNRRYRK